MAEKTIQSAGQFSALIKQKRAILKKLFAKESALEKKIVTGLANVISFENKQVSKAKKTKSKTQSVLTQRLEQLKTRQKEYEQRTHLIKDMRLRQQKIQYKIEKLKSFVAKHKPKPKPAVTKPKLLKPKPVPKPAKKITPKPKPSHVRLHKTVHPHELHQAMHKALKAAKKPHLAKKIQKMAEQLPKTSLSSPTAVEVEPLQPLEETKPQEAIPEPFQPTTETATEPPVDKSEFKHFQNDGIGFDYPAWPQSSAKPADAELSVEQNKIKFELFFSPADTTLELDGNVKKWLEQQPGLSILSQENINHFVFVTYSTSEPDAPKHYALFGQHETNLVRLEANGEANELDEQSGLIVQVFKSFSIEE